MNTKSVSKTTVICIVLSVVLAVLTLLAWLVFLPRYKAKHFTAAAPSNLSAAAPAESKAAYGDYYVSPDGNDKNNGTVDHPFRTLAAAQKAARKTKKQYLSHVVVSIMGGTYETKGLKFTKADSGTDSCSVIYCAYGNGEVIFDGGAGAAETGESDGSALAEINGVSYFSLSGVSFLNAKGDGVVVKGSSNVNVDSCRVQQTAGRGIVVSGSRVSVTSCQVSRTGASGIVVSGGNLSKLTASENTVENNLVSYTSRLDAAAPSVWISGVGASAAHNEIVNSPACALYYEGNNHTIEYNYIHNTLLTDCGQAAIDSPYYRWDCYGSTVRGNCIHLIGTKASGGRFIGIRPCSGTEVTQNLLLNIYGSGSVGVLLGGCRNTTVKNNIFINTGEAVNGTDYPAEHREEAAAALQKSPWQSQEWKKAFPACAGLSADEKSGSYAAQPAENTITNNVSMQTTGVRVGTFFDGFRSGAAIEENALFPPGRANVFTDLDGGVYTVDKDSDVYRSMKEFENVPFEEIGRY